MEILTIKLEKEKDYFTLKGELSIPVDVKEKHPDKVEEISKLGQQLCNLIAELINNKCESHSEENDCKILTQQSNSNLELLDFIEQAKAFGELAAMMKQHVPNYIPQEDIDKLNEMIQIGKIGKLAENIINKLH